MRTPIRPGPLLLLLALASCGRSPALDRSDPRAVYDEVLAAMAAGDLGRVQAVATEAGRIELERDLLQVQAMLRDPAKAAAMVAGLSLVGVQASPDRLAAARAGGVDAVWRFVVQGPRVAADPVEDEPATDAAVRTFWYQDPAGTLRRVRLVRTDAGWAVDDLQL